MFSCLVIYGRFIAVIVLASCYSDSKSESNSSFDLEICFRHGIINQGSALMYALG